MQCSMPKVGNYKICCIMTFITVVHVVSALRQPKNNRNREDPALLDDCWQLYPFTYSKCLKLCSPQADATCLDDQLCFCNLSFEYLSSPVNLVENEISYGPQQIAFQHVRMRELLPPTINTKFGAHSRATCHFSDFCEELCRNDEKLNALSPTGITYGALCKISDFTILTERSSSLLEETESCICTLS